MLNPNTNNQDNKIDQVENKDIAKHKHHIPLVKNIEELSEIFNDILYINGLYKDLNYNSKSITAQCRDRTKNMDKEQLLKFLKLQLSKLAKKYTPDVLQPSFCRTVRNLIRTIYYQEDDSINIRLSTLELKGIEPMDNCISCYRNNIKYILWSIFAKNSIYSCHSTIIRYSKRIPDSILIYYQFIAIKRKLIKKLKKNNILVINNEYSYESEFVHKQKVLLFLKKNLQSNSEIENNEINKLKKEISITDYDNISTNKIIVGYICKIMSTLFPNQKNVKSKTYNLARKIIRRNQLFAIDLNKYKQEKMLYIAKIINGIRNKFANGYFKYLNDKTIKENFHDPILEIDQYRDSLHNLLHKMIFKATYYSSHHKLKYKLCTLLLSINTKTSKYIELLTELKKNTLHSSYQYLIMFNKHNIDICIIKKPKLNVGCDLPERDSFMCYFVMIYQLIKKNLNIPMDHSLFHSKKTINFINNKTKKLDDIKIYMHINKLHDHINQYKVD